MKKVLFPLSVLAVLGCGQTGNRVAECEVIRDGDVTDEADLTEIAYDFKVYPLKSDGPIDGIQGVKFFGNKMFARSQDSEKLLCFENNSQYAVLNRLGRGPGEYIYLSDFTYDEKENRIMLGNDSVICIYDGTTLDFIRKQRVTFDIQNLLNVGDRMIYYGADLEESRKGADGGHNYEKVVILADRGEWDLGNNRTVLTKMSLAWSNVWGFPQLFYINPENYSFCIPGYVNRVVTFDNDSTTDVLSFQLQRFMGEPYDQYMNAEAMMEIDLTEFYQSYYSLLLQSNSIMGNIYNIIVDKDVVSFRADYMDAKTDDRGRLGISDTQIFCVSNGDGMNCYRHLRIPGLKNDIEPLGCHGIRNVAIIENLGADAIDDAVEMSPLARQIVEELKKQNDDNPVMVEFRFK